MQDNMMGVNPGVSGSRPTNDRGLQRLGRDLRNMCIRGLRRRVGLKFRTWRGSNRVGFMCRLLVAATTLASDLT